MSKTKRILSIVLALATILALFAGVTAFAADETAEVTAAPTSFDPAALVVYTDIADANQNYDLAFQVFSKNGLLTGYEDEGGYKLDPKKELTRAEGAAFLARLVQGVYAANNQPLGGAGFTDVADDHWASGYIKWSGSAKLIGGIGGGKFDPNGALTIAAWETMLLRTAGYGQAGEFGNDDWAYNADQLAKKAGLVYDNLSTTPAAADAVVYEDYKATITREQALQMMWKLLWNVTEVSYQYGTYREKNPITANAYNVGTAGGNTLGTPVAYALGYGKGWTSDADGFGDITGVYYSYSKAVPAAKSKLKYNEYALLNHFQVANPMISMTEWVYSATSAFDSTYIIYTEDLTRETKLGYIKEIKIPIGETAENLRTATRLSSAASNSFWTNDNVLINGTHPFGGTLATDLTSVGRYLDTMPQRDPAFGYESEVRVWAISNWYGLFSGDAFGWHAFQMTVKLPALGVIGDAVKDDPYTHIVNEAGIGITIKYSDPAESVFPNRESATAAGEDIKATYAQNTFDAAYNKVAATAKGTYVAAYPKGINLTTTGNAGEARLLWPGTAANPGNGVTLLTADVITPETSKLTGKRTGWLTLAKDGSKQVREATWLVGDSPSLNDQTYTFYRDRNGTVLGTNVQFVGVNPFKGILVIKDVDVHFTAANTMTATANTSPTTPLTEAQLSTAIEKVVFTVGLLDEGTTTRFEVTGANIARLVNGGARKTTADNRFLDFDFVNLFVNSGYANAVTASTAQAHHMDNTILDNNGDNTGLVGRFFGYARSTRSDGYVYTLRYLDHTQFDWDQGYHGWSSSWDGTPIASHQNGVIYTDWTNGLLATVPQRPVDSLKTATYIWTEGYTLNNNTFNSGTPGYGSWFNNTALELGAERKVPTYTEKVAVANGANDSLFSTAWTSSYWDNTLTGINGSFSVTANHATMRPDGWSNYIVKLNPSSMKGPAGFQVPAITDIGFIDPYAVAAPRTIGLFTGKITYTTYGYVLAEFLIDGAIKEYKVESYAVQNDRPKFVEIVEHYGWDGEYTDVVELFDHTGNVFGDGEGGGTYTIHYEKIKSSTLSSIGSKYPWSKISQWRDIMEYGTDLNTEYTAALGSESSWAIWVTYAPNTAFAIDAGITALINKSATTQVWIIPDRNYTQTDIQSRLNLA